MKKYISLIFLLLSFIFISCNKQYTRIMIYSYGYGDNSRNDSEFDAENDSAAFVQTLQYFILLKYGLDRSNIAMFRVVDENGRSVHCPNISEHDWKEVLIGVTKSEDIEYVRNNYEHFFCY